MFLTVFHCLSPFICPRVNCSDCSLKKSVLEQITLIPLIKSVTVSESLLKLFTKERLWVNRTRHSLKKSNMIWANHSQKPAIHSKKFIFFIYFWQFSLLSPFFMPNSKLLQLLFAQSLFFKERRESFFLVALYKRATMSDLLPSIFTKERPWAIPSCGSLQKSDGSYLLFFMSDLLFFTSESLFRSQKTSDWFEKLNNEFPTLGPGRIF